MRLKKKILITGVTGMIGSHLLDALLQKGGYDIVGIDNLSYGKLINIQHNLSHPDFKFYRVDIADIDALKMLAKDVSIILHLAAVKKISDQESSMPTLTVNAKGTENIFEVAKMWGCKI